MFTITWRRTVSCSEKKLRAERAAGASEKERRLGLRLRMEEPGKGAAGRPEG